jgi:hypothetical protein
MKKVLALDRIKQILTQEDTVLFIGSGISLWSGLPTWQGLIKELTEFLEASGVKADLVRAEAERGDLLQAASYGFDKLTKQQIGDFIRSGCRYGTARPHEVHRKIVSLGPRCYITTNYDNLLEEALRVWRPDLFFRPPITNRHLTETAEIVHARSIDFVFKPHGDAADCESIILTREQYRQLLPQGELHNALESLKILLASRPVIYLGFGLRDPDFMYVRDILANIYKGGARDHYAIMADVTETECDYWRRNYGIHLISYSTRTRSDKIKDHGELLSLLDSLLTHKCKDKKVSEKGLHTPDVALSLLRHAARMMQTPKVDPEFPIYVHVEHANKWRGEFLNKFTKFDHCPIDKFLDDGPERALLIGLPGAGKTYALHQAAARFAERLHEVCLSETYDETVVIIPILIDLKLYRGDLLDLIDQTLPKSIPFKEISVRFKVKIFIDSFNEMPREYWESGSYESDFIRFAESFEQASIIIGSRTSSGLEKLDFPKYNLDQIEDSVVDAILEQRDIVTNGRFNREIRSLLQKPFYFQLVLNGAVNIPKEPHPRDIFFSFFNKLSEAFTTRFGKVFKLVEALSQVAYDATNRGEEAFPLFDLHRILKDNLKLAGIQDIDARDIANWLVSTMILIPQKGGRIAFVHQSITEFLAAKELVRYYQLDPQIIKEKLSLRRWDQALFFTLSFLTKSQAETFFNDIVSIDLALALKAAKYIEVDRDIAVSKLLSLIPAHLKEFGDYYNEIDWIVESDLPISESNEPQLRFLMELRGLIGGVAVKRLVELKGTVEIKDELLNSMIEARSDYNYCRNGIASALKPFVTEDDIYKIARLADTISHEVTSDSDKEIDQGFISGVAMLLSDLEISAIKKGLLPSIKSESISEIKVRILCEILNKHHSTEALNLAGELLLHGVHNAATSVCMVANSAKQEQKLSWISFNENHIRCLISMISNPRVDSWAVKALKCICTERSDLAKITRRLAFEMSGIIKATLIYCSEKNNIVVFEALGELINMPAKQRIHEPIHLLKQLDIKWTGHGDLFVNLLKLRDPKLAFALIYPLLHCVEKNILDKLDLKPIDWWFDWIMEENDFWLTYVITNLLSISLNQGDRDSILIEFNKPNSKYCSVIAHSAHYLLNDITTNELSEEAISFLLADLNKLGAMNALNPNPLGRMATEQFVEGRLFPLLPDAKGHLLTNLKLVIWEAGERHGRRYI